MELPDEIIDKIVATINSKGMMVIGTSLKLELEGEINAILPPDYEYIFNFNMSGDTESIINYKGQLLYRF